MNIVQNGQPAKILLVEDNPGDVRLILEEFKDSKLDNHLDVVGDGVEATDYLTNKGAWPVAPRPDLILLDLNLPRKSGQEVLQEIKDDNDLKKIPVVILTSLSAEGFLFSKTSKIVPEGFLTKPLKMKELTDILKSLSGHNFGVE
jgi:CheY-like chemotaxis protein